MSDRKSNTPSWQESHPMQLFSDAEKRALELSLLEAAKESGTTLSEAQADRVKLLQFQLELAAGNPGRTYIEYDNKNLQSALQLHSATPQGQTAILLDARENGNEAVAEALVEQARQKNTAALEASLVRAGQTTDAAAQALAGVATDTAQSLNREFVEPVESTLRSTAATYERLALASARNAELRKLSNQALANAQSAGNVIAGIGTTLGNQALDTLEKAQTVITTEANRIAGSIAAEQTRKERLAQATAELNALPKTAADLLRGKGEESDAAKIDYVSKVRYREDTSTNLTKLKHEDGTPQNVLLDRLNIKSTTFRITTDGDVFMNPATLLESGKKRVIDLQGEGRAVLTFTADQLNESEITTGVKVKGKEGTYTKVQSEKSTLYVLEKDGQTPTIRLADSGKNAVGDGHEMSAAEFVQQTKDNKQTAVELAKTIEANTPKPSAIAGGTSVSEQQPVQPAAAGGSVPVQQNKGR